MFGTSRRTGLATGLVGVAVIAGMLLPWPTGVRPLVWRPMLIMVWVALSWLDDRHRSALEEWSAAPRWVRYLLVASISLFALWWLAALTAAIRLGDKDIVPAWALAARYAAGVGLGPVVLYDLVRRIRSRVAA